MPTYRRARCGVVPIGTGPFNSWSSRPNEHIKVTRNPDYWKPARPYLDGIRIHDPSQNASTADPGIASGKVDMTFPYSVTQPAAKRRQGSDAACVVRDVITGLYRSLIVNREKAAVRQRRFAAGDG